MNKITHAYDEMYLGDIKHAQRSLFGHLARPENNVDMDRFIIEYMNSETRAALDIGWPKVASLNGRELLTYLREEEGYEPPYGVSLFSVEEAEWVGRFFADYQWYWGNLQCRID